MKKNSAWPLHRVDLAHLIELTDEKGPQMISKDGEVVGVVISIEEYRKLLESQESLVDFFMRAPCQEVELDITHQEGTI